MKNGIVRFSLIAILLCVQSPGSGADSHRPADVGISSGAFARVQSVPFQAVTLGEGIWKARFRANAKVSIPAFYESLERAGGTKLSLSQSTRYPWRNTVNLVLNEVPSGEFSLFVRIPHWTTKATVAVNEQSPCIVNNPGSYHQMRRRWQANDRVEIKFDMPIRTVHSNPQVRENRDRAALQRGPVVYCLESVDHKDTSVFDIVLPFDLSDIDDTLETRFEPDLLGGVVTLRGVALAYDSSFSEKKLYSFAPFSGNLKPIKITAIPYFAWANRGPSEMTVWIPQAPKNR